MTENSNRGACPVIVCDECGGKIERGQSGNCLWDYLDGGAPYFTHKRCNYAFEKLRWPGRVFGWMDLDALLVYLRNNLKVNMKKAETKVVLLAQIG
jgi:hypothetical protein